MRGVSVEVENWEHLELGIEPDHNLKSKVKKSLVELFQFFLSLLRLDLIHRNPGFAGFGRKGEIHLDRGRPEYVL